MSAKPKVAVVPKWKPREPGEIVRLRWLLKRGVSDRRERERIESRIETYEQSTK